VRHLSAAETLGSCLGPAYVNRMPLADGLGEGSDSLSEQTQISAAGAPAEKNTETEDRVEAVHAPGGNTGGSKMQDYTLVRR
jgi:hypothetical protein